MEYHLDLVRNMPYLEQAQEQRRPEDRMPGLGLELSRGGEGDSEFAYRLGVVHQSNRCI